MPELRLFAKRQTAVIMELSGGEEASWAVLWIRVPFRAGFITVPDYIGDLPKGP